MAALRPFAPEIVAPTISRLAKLRVDTRNPYGFEASFNCVFDAGANGGTGWPSSDHFGIDEGETVLMIENHRSVLI